jgi:hypothetical protein
VWIVTSLRPGRASSRVSPSALNTAVGVVDENDVLAGLVALDLAPTVDTCRISASGMASVGENSSRFGRNTGPELVVMAVKAIAVTHYLRQRFCRARRYKGL